MAGFVEDRVENNHLYRDFDLDVLDESSEKEVILENHALVIGIDKYSAGIPTLLNAVEDARAVAHVLENDYGYRVISFYNEEATKLVIEPLLRQILEEDANSRWLVYFSGHGTVENGQGFLLLQDTQAHQTETYLALPWLLKLARSGSCPEVLFILDACYSGQALIAPSEISDLIPAESSGERIVQVMTSGSPDQRVLDAGGSGHSVFTQALLEALEGWAGIHNKAGSIALANLVNFLKQDVKERLAAAGHSNWSQQVIGGNLVGNRSGRDFTVQPIKPRLSPTVVTQSRDERPLVRIQALERLPTQVNQYPTRLGLAQILLIAHLQASSRLSPFSVVAPATYYEPSPEVRASAARVLGELGDSTVLDALIDALEDDDRVSRAVAGSLAQLKDIRAAGALLKRFMDAPEDLFLDIVKAVAALGSSATTITALIQAVRIGKLVPFIGPDLPRSLSGFPDRVSLAYQLSDGMGTHAQGSLAQVAQDSMGEGSSRNSFTRFLIDTFSDYQIKTGPLFLAISQIRASFWLYANYDDLLARLLHAQSITSGLDSDYWREGRPAVIQLLGSVGKDNTRLVVLEQDYKDLRLDEKDRVKLVDFITRQIKEKVVLMLGFDPESPDFSFFVKYILNEHLKSADICPILVWDKDTNLPNWSDVPIYSLRMNSLELINQIINHVKMARDENH